MQVKTSGIVRAQRLQNCVGGSLVTLIEGDDGLMGIIARHSEKTTEGMPVRVMLLELASAHNGGVPLLRDLGFTEDGAAVWAADQVEIEPDMTVWPAEVLDGDITYRPGRLVVDQDGAAWVMAMNETKARALIRLSDGLISVKQPPGAKLGFDSWRIARRGRHEDKALFTMAPLET
jgi:hypothetical protein